MKWLGKQKLTQTLSISLILLTKNWNAQSEVSLPFVPSGHCNKPSLVNTKCPQNISVTKNWETAAIAVHTIRQAQQCLWARLSEDKCSLASSLGMWGQVQPLEAGRKGNVWKKMRFQRFLMAAPLEWGGNFGRQGSSAPASWEKTESSPEEQVELRVSG